MNTRSRPCAECPFRRDITPGQFPADRYEKLANTSGSPGNEASFDAPLFGCHKGAEDAPLPCAGWLASIGFESLRVRLLVSAGKIPAEALQPGDDWPPLHESYEAMAAAQGGPRGAESYCPNERCASFGHWQTVVPGYPCPVCKVATMTDGGRRA